MMKAIQLYEDIYWIGANISTNDLFEGIWPIPNGVTLNSYVVKGEKIAIVDLVRDWGGAPAYVLSQLDSVGVKPEDIDYVILNHLEPDHTGWLDVIQTMAKKAKIVTTAKGKDMAMAFYHVPEERIQVVGSGDSLDLGNGKNFVFQEIPNVHWPETMVTYETSTKTLFSCDAFGSFGALKGSIFDDEVAEVDWKYYEEETLRYYANIVGPFSNAVRKALEAVDTLEISMIAPSHGLIWRKDPQKIIEQYRAYANYNTGYAEPEITLIWGSMYGNTEKMMRAVLTGIAKENVPVHIFHTPEDDISYILAKAWKSAGLIFGMPTYEYKMFPPMRYAVDLLKEKRATHKKIFRFGSYGWSGGAQREFDEMTKNLKWEALEPLRFQGAPTEEDLEKGIALGQQLAQEVKKIPRKWPPK